MSFVKIYQYQIEFEGGMRFGPSWNHREECAAYALEEVQPYNKRQKMKIKKFWARVPRNKLRAIEAEFVK